MKILLINPPYIREREGIKESAGHAIPLNLAYLAAYTREHIDCDISILDIDLLNLTYSETKKRIKEISPDIIGITCPTPTLNNVLRIAKIVKTINPNCIVVVGGPHPTAMPKETAKFINIDFVVVGEGEVTFMELVKAIKSKKSKKYLNNIPGLSTSKPRELIKNLDKVPFPARDLFNLNFYKSAVTKKLSYYKSTSIMTSRGCPYNCIHCISKLIWKRKYRIRSVKNVVNEIEECIKKYNIREFNFYDDTFTINKKQVIDICREIVKRNLKISWICFGRVNIIDQEMVKEMKKAGCKKIAFGLESGSQKILDLMRKQATLDMARRAVKIVKEERIEAHAAFMLGNIGETKKTIKETIKFATDLNLDNATFFITTPFPGTDLYKIAKEKGNINENTRWEDFAPISKTSPILVQNNITKEELVKLQKRAFREFYLRPKYVIHKLLKISSFEDIKTIFGGLMIFLRIQKR